MPTQQGLAHLSGTPLSTAKCYSAASYTTELFSGYVFPNVQAADISHEAESDRVKSSSGEYTGIILSGEKLSCSFDLIPEGDTLAHAAVAGSLPPIGSTFDLRGLPVVAAGSWSDAFNVSASGSYLQNRWIYEGGGTVSGKNTGNFTMRVTLHRYPSITGLANAIIS
jgi:hypothetical protein